MISRSPIAGVIGHPIGHSKSPRIHNHWLRLLDLPGIYLPYDVGPDDFETFVQRANHAGFAGFNVTIPHKERAFRLCDALSETAKACAAVNTLVFQRDGSVVGDSTDGFGFMENLRNGGFAPRSGFSAAILGAGGAARAVAVALREAGASEIRLANRTQARAEDLAEVIDPVGRLWTWPVGEAFFADCDLIVNATSLGMDGQPPFDIELGALSDATHATDLIYAPLRTPFLQRAEAAGAQTTDGLGMLLHQARPGFEAWFGGAPTVDAALREVVLSDGGLFP